MKCWVWRTFTNSPEHRHLSEAATCPPATPDLCLLGASPQVLLRTATPSLLHTELSCSQRLGSCETSPLEEPGYLNADRVFSPSAVCAAHFDNCCDNFLSSAAIPSPLGLVLFPKTRAKACNSTQAPGHRTHSKTSYQNLPSHPLHPTKLLPAVLTPMTPMPVLSYVTRGSKAGQVELKEVKLHHLTLKNAYISDF